MVGSNEIAPSAGEAGAGHTSGASGAFTVPFETTVPEAILMHWITDEQLEKVAVTGRDNVLEATWGLGGVALGFLPEVYQAWEKISSTDPAVQFGRGDLFNVAAFLICASVSATLFLTYRKNKLSVQAELETIRNRQRL